MTAKRLFTLLIDGWKERKKEGEQTLTNNTKEGRKEETYLAVRTSTSVKRDDDDDDDDAEAKKWKGKHTEEELACLLACCEGRTKRRSFFEGRPDRDEG